MIPEHIPITELHRAADRQEVVQAMRAFYAEADSLIAAQGATCWNRGACCRFEAYGHSLYVTALEVCYYLAQGDEPCGALDDVSPPAASQGTGGQAASGTRSASRTRAASRTPAASRTGAASGTPAAGGTSLPVLPKGAGGDTAVNTRPRIGSEGTCPHAFDGRCHVRDHRPLGCRIFFCDETAQAWQGPLTETLLARLRGMHTELGVPYFYAEWLTVLRALRDERRGAAKDS